MKNVAKRRHSEEFFLFALFFSVLTLLIRNAAAGLACRLAGGLTFAASAVFCAFAKIAGFQSFDMFHVSLRSGRSKAAHLIN